MGARLALGRAAVVFALAFAAVGAEDAGDLLAAARSGDTEAVRALLKRGANLEAQDKDGKTPLLWAAERGHTEIVRLLLAQGANREARDREGLTAYDLALLSSEGKHEAILNLLPRPPRVRIAVDALWLPVNMIGSCFQSRADLAHEPQRHLSGRAGAGGFCGIRAHRRQGRRGNPERRFGRSETGRFHSAGRGCRRHGVSGGAAGGILRGAIRPSELGDRRPRGARRRRLADFQEDLRRGFHGTA